MVNRAVIVLLLLLPTAGFPQDFATVPDDLDTAISAVVRISGIRNGSRVQGSGFVVGLAPGKATIVTASHVIQGVEQLRVTFAADRTESFPAGIVLGMEAGNSRGLAVFQVRGDLPAGVTTLSFVTETQLRRGEDVFLIGFPEMAEAPLTLRRTFAGPTGNFLQLDQPAGEGISGAPVLGNGGRVFGVVVEENLHLTFAVKALVARDAITGWEGSLGSQTSTVTSTPAKPAPPPAEAACVPGQSVTDNGIDYVRICPGTFTMGSAEDDPQAWADEKPAHQVRLSEEFWLARTEITNAQYRRFQPKHQGEDKLPAAGVTWTEAKAACEHFGGRLPTEAEWEYAARAGSTTAWSFAGDENSLSDYAWFEKNAGDTTHPVATKKPNAWGLYDIHGNVSEWVADWYAADYTATAQSDPTGPATDEYLVLRGGAFDDPPRVLRSADRDWFLLELGVRGIGFRCARGPRRQP